MHVTAELNKRLESKSHKVKREGLEKKFKVIEKVTGNNIKDLIKDVKANRALIDQPGLDKNFKVIEKVTGSNTKDLIKDVKDNRALIDQPEFEKTEDDSSLKYQWKIGFTTPYSKLGHSLLAADYNGDGVTDLIIGAPWFHGKGLVLIVDGITLNGTSASEDIVIKGKVPNGGFGWSLAFQDGNVFIGSPFEGTEDLTYTGGVYSFDITNNSLSKVPVPEDNQVGTFGWALARTSKGVKYSGKYNYGDQKQSGAFGDSQKIYRGTNNYDWSGSTLTTFKSNSGKEYLAVGSPNHQVDNNLVGAGKVEIRPVNNMGTIVATIHGIQSFEGFGHSITTGKLKFDDGLRDVLVIGSPFYSNPHTSTHRFAGSVNIFSLDEVDEGQLKHLARLDGDMVNGNFGKAVVISENNELFVSAPKLAKTGLLLGPGRVYRFKDFQDGGMTNDCVDSPCPAAKAESIIDAPYQEHKGQMFGFSLATGDKYLFVGSPREDVLLNKIRQSQAGAVYVFDISKM